VTDLVAGSAARANRLPLAALLVANGISLAGNRMTDVAIPWFVLETTGSAGKTGLVGVATVVPIVLTAFFGSGIVDRFGFKATSVISDLASAGTVALIPLLNHAVGLAFWQLLTLVFLGAVLDTPGQTARQSLFPDLVVLAGVPALRANAIMQGIVRLSWLLAPPLAGVLIALVGVGNVLWFDAASFVVSALLVGLAVPAHAVRATVAEVSTSLRAYLGGLAEGLVFIRRDRLILLLECTATLGNALGAALFAVALPVYAFRTFDDATALGLLLSGFGAGALVGVFLYGAVGYRLSSRRVFIGALLVGTAAYWIVAATPPLAVGILAMLLAGLGTGPFGPIVTAVFQNRVPPELRARVFGTAYAIDNATTPLAILCSGVLLDRLALGVVLGLIALVDTLVSIVVMRHPALRELDEAAQSPSAG
jgi:MFS family permease